jgi:hypothetical protein
MPDDFDQMDSGEVEKLFNGVCEAATRCFGRQVNPDRLSQLALQFIEDKENDLVFSTEPLGSCDLTRVGS